MIAKPTMKWKGNDSYQTPESLYQALDMEFAFNLDPCPLNVEFDPSIHSDGLALDWTDKRVFCNPPWSTITPWVDKAFTSRCLTVFLLPARTDTAWFQRLLHVRADMRFFKRRVRFMRYDGTRMSNLGINGTMVAVLRNAS
jgi:hypothetical protein